MHREHLGFLWGILAAFMSASFAVCVKLGAQIPNETMVFARFVFGIFLLLPFAFHSKVSFSIRKIPKHFFRALYGLIALYCYFYAVKKLPLVNAVTLSNTTALFMPLVALIWLRVLVSSFRMLASVIGFIGVLILLRPATMTIEWATLVGLGTGIFGAIALMGVRQLSKTESTETILFYYFLICAVLTLFPMLYTWKPITRPIDWIYLFGIALFSVVYQYAITKSYTHAPATKASTLSYLSVLLSGLTGWWIFGEIPDYWVLLGAALIVFGAFLALLDKKPPRPL